MTTRPGSELLEVQRTAAYAVVTDPERALLLVRASRRSDLAGRWWLPGGGVRHGEHPAEAVRREVAEETGLAVTVTGAREAVADVIDLPHRGVRLHTVRILYDAVPEGGWPVSGLRAEPDGTSDRAEFVPPEALRDRPLMPYVARLAGLPAAPAGSAPLTGTAPERPEPLEDAEPAPGAVVRRQRPAAYAVLHSGDRLLLTHLTDSGGMWTLPGGGIDHGEQPVEALRREVYEETGLRLEPGRLVGVSSRHFRGHAPHGQLEDFHGIRLVYDGEVPTAEPPRVVEVGGTTDRVEWVPLRDLDSLQVSDVVPAAVRAVLDGHA